MMAEVVWQACAVCAYPLERVSDTTTGQHVGWNHFREAHDDHVPVPVDAASVQVNQCCDFCNVESVSFAVLCTPFMIAPGFRSIGCWTACAVCGTLARLNAWRELVVRVQGSEYSEAHRVRPEALLATYKKVEAHRYGMITIEEWKARTDFPREDTSWT